MDPFVFWAFIVLLVLALIIYGMISVKLRQRRLRRLRREAMPVVSHAVRAGVVYNVFLSNGTIFQTVKVAGLTDAVAGHDVDFPLESWLVLEKAEGKRIFVKPSSVRFFEEP